MRGLEFIFKPHYCNACIFTGGCWCEVSLRPTGSDALQRVVFLVKRGDTIYGPSLLPYMEDLVTMFMSTARGLTA